MSSLDEWRSDAYENAKLFKEKVKRWHDKKISDALWAYRTAYKNPMGMSPYKMVYGKAFHFPLELEHKEIGRAHV